MCPQFGHRRTTAVNRAFAITLLGFLAPCDFQSVEIYSFVYAHIIYNQSEIIPAYVIASKSKYALNENAHALLYLRGTFFVWCFTFQSTILAHGTLRAALWYETQLQNRGQTYSTIRLITINYFVHTTEFLPGSVSSSEIPRAKPLGLWI